MLRTLFFRFALVAVLTTLAFPALADVTIRVEDSGEKVVIYLTPDAMAILGDDGTVMFNAEDESIAMKMGTRAQVMTKQQLMEISKMAAAMKSRPGAETSEDDDLPTSFKKMDKSRVVHGRNAQGYWILKGEEQRGEVWVADLKSLGVSRNDLQIISKLALFLKDVAEGNPMMQKQFADFQMMDPTHPSFIGFPLSMTDEDGSTTVVTSFEKGDVDRAIFELN